MTTKKKATAKRKETPRKPPRIREDALLLDAQDAITDTDITNFASCILASSYPKSEAKRKAVTKSVMRFATLGWQYYCMTKVP